MNTYSSIDEIVKDKLTMEDAEAVSKLAEKAILIISQDPGNASTHRLYLLSKDVERTIGRIWTDPNDLAFRTGVSFAFERAAKPLFEGMDAIIVGQEALGLCGALDEIVKARNLISRRSGLDAASQLRSYVLIAFDWMKLDLLSFAWKNGRPRCRDIFGFLLATAHQAGSVGGLGVNRYGPECLTRMFVAASEEGLALGSRAPQTPPQRVIYRGGFASDPQALAAGMCWTEDFDQAAWYADRQLGQLGTAYVLSTEIDPEDALARFEHEAEVVLPYNERRAFQIVQVDAKNFEQSQTIEEMADADW